MNKENIDPKFAKQMAKNNKASVTMPILRTRSNRRVSFAPEVTLHKIDLIPRRETIGYFHDSSSRESSDQSSRPSSSSSGNNDEMELTTSFTKVVLNSPTKVPRIDQNPIEEDMELTEPINVNFMTNHIAQPTRESKPIHAPVKWVEFKTLRSSIAEDSMQLTNNPIEEEMDLTQPVNAKFPENTIPKVPSDEEMELTQPVSLVHQEPMEITQPVSLVHQEPMELTYPISRLTPNTQKEMELTEINPNQREMELTEINPINTQKEMELTEMSSVNPINIPQPKMPAIQEEMELTQPVQSFQPEKPYRLSTPRTTLTPHFPEVEIPLPEMSPHKRRLEIELSPRKSPRTIANVPLQEEDDSDYIHVSLSTFLEDLGIKFYDDLQINKLDRLSVSTTIQEDFSFNDYVKAAGKLLVYSLFEFSNKELVNNISEGKKIYDQLNKSILNNNPKLFKEFYGSNDDEKLIIKSEFLLIKDFSRFQAKKVWYNWRIQLLENLLVQMDEKYIQLCQDKRMLTEDLAAINEQFSEKWETFQNLKTKLSKVADFKVMYDGYSRPEMMNIKQELVNIRNEIIVVQSKITDKVLELNEIKNQVTQNQDTINHLTKEIAYNQQKVEDNKNYELNEIKSLNLKFKILQQLTSITYLSKVNDIISFQFREFQVDIDFSNSKTSLKLVGNSFQNQWLGQYVIDNFNKLAQLNFIEKCKKLNDIISVAKLMDIDIFKISCKFPIVHTSGYKFTIRYYCMETNIKANLHMEIPADISQYPNGIAVHTEIIKGDTANDLITKFIKDCHSSSQMLRTLNNL